MIQVRTLQLQHNIEIYILFIVGSLFDDSIIIMCRTYIEILVVSDQKIHFSSLLLYLHGLICKHACMPEITLKVYVRYGNTLFFIIAITARWCRKVLTSLRYTMQCRLQSQGKKKWPDKITNDNCHPLMYHVINVAILMKLLTTT